MLIVSFFYLKGRKRGRGGNSTKPSSNAGQSAKTSMARSEDHQGSRSVKTRHETEGSQSLATKASGQQRSRTETDENEGEPDSDSKETLVREPRSLRLTFHNVLCHFLLILFFSFRLLMKMMFPVLQGTILLLLLARRLLSANLRLLIQRRRSVLSKQ